MNSKLPVIIIGFVGIAVIVGALIFVNMSSSNGNKPANTATNSANSANKPKVNELASAVQGAEPAWSRGPANATVTLEEFADFQCPSCALFQPTLREIKTVYSDRVRIIFRQFPLTQIHQKAYDASRAAEAAGKQGKFWEMHDLLYQKQKDWTVAPDFRKELSSYAQQLGLDVAKFETDMVSNEVSQRVAADMKRGQSVNITGTPTIFLNGRRLLYPDEMTVDRMRRLIDEQLQGKQQQ